MNYETIHAQNTEEVQGIAPTEPSLIVEEQRTESQFDLAQKPSDNLFKQIEILVKEETELLQKTLSSASEETGTYLVQQVKPLLQTIFNKIMDRLEDPTGRYSYKSLSSFLKGMIGLYDHLGDLDLHPWPEHEQQHSRNYRALRRQLLQLLLMHDLEPLSPASGELFDPICHRVASVQKTYVREEESTIAGCTRDGFKMGQVVVRPADVILKKYYPLILPKKTTPSPWGKPKVKGQKKQLHKNDAIKPNDYKSKYRLVRKKEDLS